MRVNFVCMVFFFATIPSLIPTAARPSLMAVGFTLGMHRNSKLVRVNDFDGSRPAGWNKKSSKATYPKTGSLTHPGENMLFARLGGPCWHFETFVGDTQPENQLGLQ